MRRQANTKLTNKYVSKVPQNIWDLEFVVNLFIGLLMHDNDYYQSQTTTKPAKTGTRNISSLKTQICEWSSENNILHFLWEFSKYTHTHARTLTTQNKGMTEGRNEWSVGTSVNFVSHYQMKQKPDLSSG